MALIDKGKKQKSIQEVQLSKKGSADNSKREATNRDKREAANGVSEKKLFPQDKIEMVPVEKLIPYAKNPRKNDETVPKLMQIIGDVGFNVPLLIDDKNFLITGHARLKAAKALAYKELPCIRVKDLTADEIKAFRLVDNKVSEFSKWNEKLLKLEFERLKKFDVPSFDFKGFGFDDLDVKVYADGSEQGTLKRDFVVPPFSVISSTSDDCKALDAKWAGFLISCRDDYPRHLLEILYKWFTPNNGVILDPLYKSDTKSMMARILGYTYKRSIDEVNTDKVDLVYLDLLKGNCPEMSLSNYLNTIEEAISLLGDNRFVVAHLQEKNDSTLGYRSQKAAELQQFMRDHGLMYYNELVYITRSLGSIEYDKTKFLRTRLVPSRHSNIYVFYKGKVKSIRESFDKTTPEYRGEVI